MVCRFFRTKNRPTGKELDEETGYYYFGARYYDPKVSVWVSTDPALQNSLKSNKKEEKNMVYSSKLFNNYIYSSYNPISMIDPDGKKDYEFHADTVLSDSTYLASDPAGVAMIKEINHLWGGHTDYRVIKFTQTADDVFGTKQEVTLILQRPKGDEQADWVPSTITYGPEYYDDEDGKTPVPGSVGYTGSVHDGDTVKMPVWVGFRPGDDSGPEGSSIPPTYYEEYDLINGNMMNTYSRSGDGTYKRNSGDLPHGGKLNDIMQEILPDKANTDHDPFYTPRGRFKVSE